ncbi:MAG: TIGR03663 family protein [Phycisphaerales bacterium]|nr:MAG: TIGR03663 family protein [Phycisphaerales bacterium]
MKRPWFVISVLTIAALALILRLPALSHRPMHGDEAVHTVKCNTLWTTGEYRYDAQDYHGPTLYYATLPAIWLSDAKDYRDASETTFRVVPVLFGVGIVLLLLLLGDAVGRPAAVVSGLLIAVSPAMVYYSRYYIQEMLLAFFTLAALATGWRYVCCRRRVWALACGACLGLMHTTKETSLISFGAMLPALFGAMVWKRRASPESSRHHAAGNVLTLVGAALIAVVVSFTCYSVLFTNFENLHEVLRALPAYWRRGAEVSIHHHPWFYYLHTLLFAHLAPGPMWTEGLIVVLALIGAVVIVKSRQPAGTSGKFPPFLMLYTVFLVFFYSAIPYKTPWCVVQMLSPMILLGGVGAVAVFRGLRWAPARVAAVSLLAAGGIHLAQQAYAASFKFSADSRNPYAYAHPVNDVKNLAGWLDKVAEVHPDGRAMLIKIIHPDPWPLPWYLRAYARVGYWEEMPRDVAAPVIICGLQQQPTLETRLQGDYRVDHYGLRPGSMLAVYVQRALYERFARQQSTTSETDGAGHE